MPDHAYARFSRFKSQFGGEVQRFIGAHDYWFMDRLSAAVIEALQEIGEIGTMPEQPESVEESCAVY